MRADVDFSGRTIPLCVERLAEDTAHIVVVIADANLVSESSLKRI